MTVLTHTLVWIVFGLTVFFRRPVFSGIDISYQLWVKQTVTLCLLVIAFYANSFVLVPTLLLKKQTAWYFILIIAIVVVIMLCNAWVDISFQNNSPSPAAGWLRLRSLPRAVLRRHVDTLTVIISALVLVIGTIMTVMQKWQKDKQEREELEKDKISSELSFLKAQINPHFFFNTLNNIYALTQIDGPEAGKAVHQLSRMMRYLLYETQEGQTSLSREIALVKDYLSLMQLRLTPLAIVTIDTPERLRDMPMASMVLLPFVENAFKHGVSATKESHIDIRVQQQAHVLDLVVKNSIMKENSSSLEANSGIGLVNTRRRLDLLYPDKYKLEIGAPGENDEYTIHLILDLS